MNSEIIHSDGEGRDHRRFVLPIFRLPANKCFGCATMYQRTLNLRDEFAHHFGLDGAVALSGLRLHIAASVTEIAQLDGLRCLL